MLGPPSGLGVTVADPSLEGVRSGSRSGVGRRESKISKTTPCKVRAALVGEGKPRPGLIQRNEDNRVCAHMDASNRLRRPPMTVQDHPYPRVEMLINSFAAWLKHR